MKALITGIDGFVGEYLAEYLIKKGIEVWGTTRKKRKYLNSFSDNDKVLQMDILNSVEIEFTLNKIQPHYIFHLAAQSSAAISWENPQMTMDVNINGTLNLLETVRKSGFDPSILLIGSSEEYGFVSPCDIPIDENQIYNPGNPYAISKISQTMLGQLFVDAYRMNIVIARSFNHIGPKQSQTFVVSDFAKRIAEIEKGLREPVIKVGNLNAIRDFTDVRDVVEAYHLILSKGINGEIYNVGSGKGYKIEWILHKLLQMSRNEIRIEKDTDRMRPSDVPIIECNNTKIKELTQWQPKIPLEQTLEDVLNYWRKFINTTN